MILEKLLLNHNIIEIIVQEKNVDKKKKMYYCISVLSY